MSGGLLNPVFGRLANHLPSSTWPLSTCASSTRERPSESARAVKQHETQQRPPSQHPAVSSRNIPHVVPRTPFLDTGIFRVFACCAARGIRVLLVNNAPAHCRLGVQASQSWFRKREQKDHITENDVEPAYRQDPWRTREPVRIITLEDVNQHNETGDGPRAEEKTIHYTGRATNETAMGGRTWPPSSPAPCMLPGRE